MMEIWIFLGKAGLSVICKRLLKDNYILTKLTSKGVKFIWNKECEDNFQKLKECLTTTLILVVPLGIDGYVIYYDAS